LAVSPAAGPYRASGLVRWHETVMAVLSPQVRYKEVNGSRSVAVRGLSLTETDLVKRTHLLPTVCTTRTVADVWRKELQ
jgi:hypothetical protein